MIRRAVAAASAFVLGFAAACVLISQAVPQVRVRKVSDKIEMFQSHGDEFDTVLLGSSRTGRQVIPAVFDRAMAAAGIPTRTYNLGIEGMRPPMDMLVLEKALAGRVKPLKFLIVECIPLQSLMSEEDKWTTQSIFTHDAKRLMVFWRHAWATPLDEPFRGSRYLRRLREYLPEFAVHFRHFIWNYARISEGSARLAAAITGVPRKELLQTPPPDGFYIRETELEPLAGKELKRYQKDLAAMRAKPPKLQHLDAVNQGELREKKALADRFGAKLVLVSPPFIKSSNFHPRDMEDVVFIDYSDANRYPEFYAPESRRDYGHLNDDASIGYTKSLAERIAAALRDPT